MDKIFKWVPLKFLIDPDSICSYYMQGKCHRGDDCPYSHNALPPRKMELCKFYLMDCCAKRDKCLYMHHDFPCKFFHTGLKCGQGENCKFSHQPLNEQVISKNLYSLFFSLLYSLTADDEDFSRQIHVIAVSFFCTH